MTPKREGAVDFLIAHKARLTVSAAKRRGPEHEAWGVVLQLEDGYPTRREAARAADRMRLRLAEVLEREGVDAGSLPGWSATPYDPGASVGRAGKGGAR